MLLDTDQSNDANEEPCNSQDIEGCQDVEGATCVKVLPLPNDLLQEEDCREYTEEDVNDREQGEAALKAKHTKHAIASYSEAPAKLLLGILGLGYAAETQDLARQALITCCTSRLILEPIVSHICF